MAMYFLGIDGGGSGTRATIISESREVIGCGHAGPSNHYSVGPELAAQNCASAAAAATADAQQLHPELHADDIVRWGFGLAGVGREADRRVMHHFLSLICSRSFALDTDVAAAHAGAFGGGPGITVSVGTGTIVLGIDEAGEKCIADGWGPLLGDEGGGYWIGSRALRTACRSFDGRIAATPLANAVLEALEVRDSAELVSYVYSPACTRDKVASLSQVVLQLADEGVPEAVDIRARAVEAITESIKAVARCLLQRRIERSRNTNSEVEPLELSVALRGGLLEDDFFRATLGFAVTEIMVELKRDYFPISNWRVVRPQYDASVGAAILAQLKL